MSLSVAIVGAGPAGFFTADALLKATAGVEIDVFDRAFAPFGLVRTGVAPDHQGTKAIARQFQRVLDHDRVRFFGNVSIGRDVQLAELRRAYHIVILAVGSELDRSLNIPGENLEGVYGARAFVGWINKDPDYASLSPRLGQHLAIIGNGNVALDIARVLSKRGAQWAGSDISDIAESAIARSGIARISILGRRNVDATRFSINELRELSELDDVALEVCNASSSVADTGRAGHGNVAEFFEAAASRNASRRNIRFVFNTVVERIDARDCRLRLSLTGGPAGSRFMDVDAVVGAIGFRSPALDGFPDIADDGGFRNVDGYIESSLYAVGWCARGASGTIATNRQEAKAVVAKALSVEHSAPSSDRGLFLRRLKMLPEPFIDKRTWHRIDGIERERASAHRIRDKVADPACLLNWLATVDNRSEK